MLHWNTPFEWMAKISIFVRTSEPMRMVQRSNMDILMDLYAYTHNLLLPSLLYSIFSGILSHRHFPYSLHNVGFSDILLSLSFFPGTGSLGYLCTKVIVSSEAFKPCHPQYFACLWCDVHSLCQSMMMMMMMTHNIRLVTWTHNSCGWFIHIYFWQIRLQL